VSVTGVALLVVSALYLGFQWTIRIVVYPQFALVGPAEFTAYERMHQRRVSIAVGPLFAGLAVTAVGVLARPPSGAPRWAGVLAAALVAGLLAVTGLLAVPLHRRLGVGFERAAHRRLLMVDSLRLALAAALTVTALALAVS